MSIKHIYTSVAKEELSNGFLSTLPFSKRTHLHTFSAVVHHTHMSHHHTHMSHHHTHIHLVLLFTVYLLLGYATIYVTSSHTYVTSSHTHTHSVLLFTVYLLLGYATSAPESLRVSGVRAEIDMQVCRQTHI